MERIIKISKSKYWDLFPVFSFLSIAILEENGYIVGGVSVIIWLFTMACRHFIKKDKK